MKQKQKGKHFIIIKFIVINAVFAGIVLYSASFPSTMGLLDKATSEIFGFFGADIKFSAFSDFSEFSEKILDKAEKILETAKENLNYMKKTDNKISSVLISCAASFPSEGNRVTSEFGEREDPFSGRKDFHKGIDIAAPEGSGVFSAWPGKVYETGFDEISGKYIILVHSEEFHTKYCHLSEIFVKENDIINAGEKIGEAGSTGRSTGSHLHFEVSVCGMLIDPSDCLAF